MANFNAKKAQEILEAVRKGLEPDRAAVAYGLTPAEHDEWVIGGRDALVSKRKPTPAQSKRIAYVRKLDAAMALAEPDALVMVRDGAKGWQAFRWLLERRYPERWAKTPAAVAVAKSAASSSGDKVGELVPESRLDKLRRDREERRASASR